MKHFTYIVLSLVMIILSSCADFLEVANPKTELVSADVFKSDITATAAVMSIYSQLSLESGALNSITFLGPLLADEAMLVSAADDLQQVYTNNITTTNGRAINLWGSAGYSNIYQANALLEGLSNNSQLAAEVKTRLEGEALFLRAFTHFYLVNLFGNIPYVTSTDYKINTGLSQLSIAQVYDHIIADLISAQDKLPVDYELDNGERIRATRSAASALLARAYLYNGNDALAEAAASAVIEEQSLYSLLAHEEVFLKNSGEAIWQLRPLVSGRNTNEGSIFILSDAPRFSFLRPAFVGSFEEGDARKEKWIGSIMIDEVTYDFPYKYKIQFGSDPLDEYSMVLRLAEQYLIRAEARAKQGKLAGAIADLDQIRNRSGLPLVSNTNPSMSKEELLLAIEQERAVELFSEWGHRWFDLKRTGRIDEVLSAVKLGWQSTDALFPIPQSEVLINKNLHQNPGY